MDYKLVGLIVQPQKVSGLKKQSSPTVESLRRRCLFSAAKATVPNFRADELEQRGLLIGSWEADRIEGWYLAKTKRCCKVGFVFAVLGGLGATNAFWGGVVERGMGALV